MTIRFSTDVVLLGDLNKSPDRVVKHAAEAGRPELLKSRGRAVNKTRSQLAVDALRSGARREGELLIEFDEEVDAATEG